MGNLKIGMIGLDTSHAVAFTKLLNDHTSPFHVKGGTVVMAYPGGSFDFALSYSRISGITKEVEQYGVQIVETIEEVVTQCDAILLESVDGRVHLEQLKKLVRFKKPTFVDKPFCLDSSDAAKMVELAEKYHTPIMSSSALRFAEALSQALSIKDKGKIIGADCFGPMEMVETQPGYFWYGIHTIEMLYTILGAGAKNVTTISNQDYDLIISQWENGRIGTARGNRKGNYEFGAVIHFEKGQEYVRIDSSPKPYYASLLEQIILFFNGSKQIVPVRETQEIIRFIEAANESRETGRSIGI
ncbi:Gfo/Idh/MocA family protein [Neobacillus dielmonensis]|uniref:Gfo/Idh/MocA family protein n=1 Tax=Neobacillus dielmonensis TaxID=1347369 RepID=UPI0005A79325|nr:Gfo/Idh/MocA family oxidoreductase [Neobacillus dielmonensis]